jgi:hypothetical protein
MESVTTEGSSARIYALYALWYLCPLCPAGTCALRVGG